MFAYHDLVVIESALQFYVTNHPTDEAAQDALDAVSDELNALG